MRSCIVWGEKVISMLRVADQHGSTGEMEQRWPEWLEAKGHKATLGPHLLPRTLTTVSCVHRVAKSPI